MQTDGPLNQFTFINKQKVIVNVICYAFVFLALTCEKGPVLDVCQTSTRHSSRKLEMK